MGKTNVGKSTLFNSLLKKKLSITSNRKNTTKKYIIGIETKKNIQRIYIDTIGFNSIKSISNFFLKNNKIIKNINKINKINLIILIVDVYQIKKNINLINKIIKFNNKISIIILINKIDKIKNKNILLPLIKKILFLKHIKIFPISIKKYKDILKLKKIIDNYKIEVQKHIFKKSQKTNLTIKERIINVIQEKFFKYFKEEIPYILNIKLKNFKKTIKKEYLIKINIFVKTKRQKKIIIGKKGCNIKICCIKSKIDIQKILKKKVHLFLWIKTCKIKN